MMDTLKGSARAIRRNGLIDGGMSPLKSRRAAKEVMNERLARESTAFKSRVRKDGKEEILFNRPGDGARHGHVVQDPNSRETYYARDEDGNEYIDKKS